MTTSGSLYPSISIEWNLLTRSGDIKKYKEIYDTRMKYKKEKNPLQLPYKLILNSSYGISRTKFSTACDFRNGRAICINGQLMLLMLLEWVEQELPHLELLNANTDGIVFAMPKEDEDRYNSIIQRWEYVTRLKMSTDYITAIAQRDVNNYVAVFDGGVWERKGSVFKASSTLDYDLPIIQNAVCEYFINGVHPKTFIENETRLMPFMKTFKVSSSYLHAVHNGQQLDGKVFRVFASKRRADTPLFKAKDKGEKGIVLEKFANSPRCYIDNSDITEKECPRYLDKQWYIDYAIKQINSVYGYDYLC